MNNSKIPNHISFIMDGNRRWSKKKNISKVDSYKIGAVKILSLAKYIFSNYNVSFISAFALSLHNFKRPKSITQTLIKVFHFFLEKFENSNFNYKVIFLGDLNFLDKDMLKKVNQLKDKNKDSIYTLILFVNYSGRKDIENAKLNNKEKNKFSKFLITKDFPDPDILIRTGGYKRLSDFLLYQLSFTELFFLKKLWPDINTRDVNKIINSFSKINRNFGI